MAGSVYMLYVLYRVVQIPNQETCPTLYNIIDNAGYTATTQQHDELFIDHAD